jgi:hypothetical protein
MQMGMKLQFLTPGMEHAEEADFGAEMAGITGDFEQRFRTGLVPFGELTAPACGHLAVLSP